jgi:DNA-binding NarL/FixJ family response regulator
MNTETARTDTATIRVAIAEDQNLFRACIVPMINQLDGILVVAEASNGKELVTWLHVTAEKPHVVLLDLAMPEMNGLETTKYLKQHFPEIRIVILSVFAEERHITKMVDEGVHAYLAKNADLEEVERAIRGTHELGFYFNETTLQIIHNSSKNKKSRQFDLENPLTNREREILQLICAEHTTGEIAEKLFLSTRTVEGHRNNMLEKTGLRNTAGLVLYAVRHGLLEDI